MRLKNILTIFIIIALSFTGSVTASDYVSLNGGFFIEIPENWKQIDYNTVDLFLSDNTDDPNVFNYEAVFANETNQMFFLGDYLIIKIDKFKKMTDRIRDSVLTDLGTTYDKVVENGYLEHFIENVPRDIPMYDLEKNTASVLRKLYLADGSAKYNLMFFKFTDSGVVNFFFYSPRKDFPESKLKFFEVLKSFSTENITAKLPKENIKVADIEMTTEEDRDRTDFDDGTGSFSGSVYIALGGILFIILSGALVAANKKKKQKSENS